MTMYYAVFNAFLYVILLISSYLKKRTFDSGIVLLLVYAFVSVCCIAQVAWHPNDWELTLFPFLYLFIVICMFFRPYFGKAPDISKLHVKRYDLLTTFIIMYIVCGAIDAIDNIPKVQLAILLDAAEIRTEFYQEGRVEILSMPVWIARNIVSYLRPFAIIVLFFSLSSLAVKKISNVLLSILLVSIIVPASFDFILIASRGLFVILATQFFVVFLTFKDYLSPKVLKIVKIIGMLGLAGILAYTITATISRFTGRTDYENPLDSLIFYFGHSMLRFDYGVMDTISNYTWGDYFLGLPTDIDRVCGTHFGVHFFTFVGALYFDFGPIITLLIALLFPLPLIRITCKKYVTLADLFAYLYILCFLIDGVFVVKRGYSIQLVMFYLMYLIIKKIL